MQIISHKIIEIHVKFTQFFKRTCDSLTAPRKYLTYLFLLFLAPQINTYGDTIKPDYDDTVPWHLSSDTITYNRNDDMYTAEGNVIIKKNEDQIISDQIKLNNKTMETVAQGNVIVSSEGNTIQADKMTMNLEKKTGTIIDGKIFVKANNYYLSAKRLQKTGENTYTGKRVTVTACDGDSPDWKISGKDLKVTIGGYGSVKHAILWAKKVPVFYSPYFIFPVKLERQTGLLSPSMSYSSRKGFEYEQPFFWDINDSMDITLYSYYMSKRGLNSGLEYRYQTTENSKGSYFINYLSDQKTDDDTTTLDSKYGYGDDFILRPNKDRFWFRMKTDQDIPFGIKAKIDLDYVSDQDYLLEFKNSQSGYRKTNSYFTGNFGRGLDNYDVTNRLNSLVLTKNAVGYTVNSGVKYYDNVITRRKFQVEGATPPYTYLGEKTYEDTTLQSLPFINIDGLKQKIPGTPLDYVVSSAYINYTRKDTDETDILKQKGQLFDLYPRIYLPLQFKNYASFDPSIGFRYTTWVLDNAEEISKTPDRTVYDLNLDVSTEIYKIFDIDKRNIYRIKHTIQPLVSYTYIPDKNYEKYPVFDSAYTIQENNIITYSITQTFTSKFLKNEPDNNQQEALSPEYSYNPFLRILIRQSHNLRSTTPLGWNHKKYSPLYGEVALTPINFLTLKTDTQIERGNFKENNISLTLFSKRGDTFRIEHRKKHKDLNPEPSETMLFNLNCIISKRVSIYSDYERNIETREDIIKQFGMIFKKQCWEVDVNFADENEDKKFSVMVHLVGLGEIETHASLK